MHERPTGTVTFLFSDIVGSTRAWEEHPDEMRYALERHDAIMRASIVDLLARSSKDELTGAS